MPMLLRGRWAVSGVEARVVSGRETSFCGGPESGAGRLAELADSLPGRPRAAAEPSFASAPSYW